jgi:serine/threonine-protein kinase
VAGRSDVRGASRIGAGVFGCSLIGWGLTAHHVPALSYVIPVFNAFSAALTFGVFGAVLYMAVEPFIRRRWPASLISWTRLLAGRLRDPLVGGHILVGCAFGIGLTLWSMLKMATLLNQGLVSWQNYPMLSGPGWVAHSLLWHLVWWSLVKALAFGVLLLFARVLLRREWLAMVAVVLLANAVPIVEGSHLLIQIAFEVPAAAIAVWLLLRRGVLPMIVASFISELTIYTPLTTDFAAWYSGPTLIVLTTVLALEIWSFAAALAGRPLFEDELLEPAA